VNCVNELLPFYRLFVFCAILQNESDDSVKGSKPVRHFFVYSVNDKNSVNFLEQTRLSTQVNMSSRTLRSLRYRNPLMSIKAQVMVIPLDPCWNSLPLSSTAQGSQCKPILWSEVLDPSVEISREQQAKLVPKVFRRNVRRKKTFQSITGSLFNGQICNHRQTKRKDSKAPMHTIVKIYRLILAALKAKTSFHALHGLIEEIKISNIESIRYGVIVVQMTKIHGLI
jgi:hypothetical protein